MKLHAPQDRDWLVIRVDTFFNLKCANDIGGPLTEQEARQLIENVFSEYWPDLDTWPVIFRGGDWSRDTWARYEPLQACGVITWEKYRHGLEVVVRKDLLKSRRALILVLLHEFFELTLLRCLFQSKGWALHVQQIQRALDTSSHNNLHGQAWRKVKDASTSVITPSWTGREFGSSR